MDNTVTIVGNVTRDPELRYTPSGSALVNLGVAVNRVWTDRTTNERKEQVSFFDVVCWNEQADNIAETVTKGQRVIVVGRLDQRSWEAEDGTKRSKVEIVADEVGPSCRWATAVVTKTAKTNGADSSDPGPTPPSNGKAKAPAMAGAPASYDEEPF